MITSYYWQASKSKIVRISLSPRDASCWAAYLNDQLLCDSYGSKEEAALGANKKDFDTDGAVALFSGVTVPSDIRLWRTSPPEQPAASTQTSPGDCSNRFRRPGSTQLDL